MYHLRELCAILCAFVVQFYTKPQRTQRQYITMHTKDKFKQAHTACIKAASENSCIIFVNFVQYFVPSWYNFIQNHNEHKDNTAQCTQRINLNMYIQPG